MEMVNQIPISGEQGRLPASHQLALGVNQRGDKMNRLELFVLADCFSCANALHEAAKAAAYFPTLEVVVTDLSKPNAVVPDIVFATPTFCLDGRIISLGTMASTKAYHTGAGIWHSMSKFLVERVKG